MSGFDNSLSSDENSSAPSVTNERKLLLMNPLRLHSDHHHLHGNLSRTKFIFEELIRPITVTGPAVLRIAWPNRDVKGRAGKGRLTIADVRGEGDRARFVGLRAQDEWDREVDNQPHKCVGPVPHPSGSVRTRPDREKRSRRTGWRRKR